MFVFNQFQLYNAPLDIFNTANPFDTDRSNKQN